MIFDDPSIAVFPCEPPPLPLPPPLPHQLKKRKTKYSTQETNLIKQIYVTQETSAQNFKNYLKSSIENEKIEELKRKPIHG